MTALILDGLIHFPLYVALALLVSALCAGLGWLLVRPFAQSLNTYLKLGVAGMTGAMVLVVVANFLSYLITPPLSFMIVLGVGSLIALSVWTVLIRQWWPIRLSREVWVFSLLLLLLTGFLFLGVYNQANFDEDLHRPVVASLVHGNFPIQDPLFPFWMRQYDYHYGWQLLAANVSAFFRTPDPMSLDLVKHMGLIFGFTIVWGMLIDFKTNLWQRAAGAATFFLAGPFWFFHDSFTQQYLFGITQPLVGFSVFHNLQAVSWVSIFVFFSALILIQQIISRTAYKLSDFLYGVGFLAVYLAGMALTGEFQLALVYATFGLFLLVYLVIQSVQRKKIVLPSVGHWLVITAFVVSLAVAMIQGGVLSGLFNRNKVLNPAYNDVIRVMNKDVVTEETLSQARVATGIGAISDKPILGFRALKDIGFSPIDNVYIPLTEWRTTLLTVGLFGVFVPFFIIGCIVLILRRRARGQATTYFDLLGVSLVIASVLPLVMMTRYGDQNLQRGWLIVTAIFYAWLMVSFLRLSGGLGKLSLKTALVVLLVLSWLPTMAFNTGLFLIRPQIVQFSRSALVEAPAYYPPLSPRLAAEKRLFTAMKEKNVTGNVLTLRQDGRYVVEQTGRLTYSSLFPQDAKQYTRMVSELDPALMKALNVSYVYATPEFMAQLTPKGQLHLQESFSPTLTEAWADNSITLYQFNE